MEISFTNDNNSGPDFDVHVGLQEEDGPVGAGLDQVASSNRKKRIGQKERKNRKQQKQTNQSQLAAETSEQQAINEMTFDNPYKDAQGHEELPEREADMDERTEDIGEEFQRQETIEEIPVDAEHEAGTHHSQKRMAPFEAFREAIQTQQAFQEDPLPDDLVCPVSPASPESSPEVEHSFGVAP